MNVIKFVPILLICLISFGMVESFKCFECGYFELSDGKKVPIYDRWDDMRVPFCNDFTTNANNTKEALLVSQIILG